MAIPPRPARVLVGQLLPKYHPVFRIFLVVPSISRPLDPFLRVRRSNSRPHLPIPFRVPRISLNGSLLLRPERPEQIRKPTGPLRRATMSLSALCGPLLCLAGFWVSCTPCIERLRGLIRIISGCLLIGHVCIIILVFLCQTLVYREVTRLFTLMDPKPVDYGGKDPWSKTLSWYFFATANYFLYGESIIYYFKVRINCAASCLSPSRPFVVACRLCGCKLSSVRCKPQDHQLYALHNWLRGFCHVPEEGSPQTTIRPILLGAYDDLVHRRIQVGIRDQRYQSSV